MNNIILPARTMCTKCNNIGDISATSCTACGVSFVLGEPDTWEAKAYTINKFKDNNSIPCIWDNFSTKEKMQPMGLSCSCPKCTPSY